MPETNAINWLQKSPAESVKKFVTSFVCYQIDLDDMIGHFSLDVVYCCLMFISSFPVSDKF